MRSLLTLLVLSTYVGAAVVAPAGGLVQRQASTSSKFTYATIGYSSAYQDGESTVWAPVTYDGDYSYLQTSSEYYRTCSFTYSYSSYWHSLYSYSTYSYQTVTTQCAMYTTCELGVMIADTTTFQCAGDGYMCATQLLYESWGGSDASTAIVCPYSSSNASTITTLYRQKPSPIVSTNPTTPAVTTSSSTETGSPSPAASITGPTASATNAPPASSGGSNNTGVIAGATVGGVAVLGAIGIAVLFILKRSKRYESVNPNNAATSAYPVYQPEKPHDSPADYNAHTSAYYGSTVAGSPNMQNPQPVYPEGYNRSELSGVTSPTLQQPTLHNPHSPSQTY